MEDIFKITENCVTPKYYRYKLVIFDHWVLFTLSVFISVVSSYICLGHIWFSSSLLGSEVMVRDDGGAFVKKYVLFFKDTKDL